MGVYTIYFEKNNKKERKSDILIKNILLLGKEKKKVWIFNSFYKNCLEEIKYKLDIFLKIIKLYKGDE